MQNKTLIIKTSFEKNNKNNHYFASAENDIFIYTLNAL